MLHQELCGRVLAKVQSVREIHDEADPGERWQPSSLLLQISNVLWQGVSRRKRLPPIVCSSLCLGQYMFMNMSGAHCIPLLLEHW